MGFDLLQFLEPVLKLMPSVPKPAGKVKMSTKAKYTIFALTLYLICSLIPLYGVKKLALDDPMYHLRVITASSKYTLMDLGISPIVSSGMILQFLSSFGLINRDPTNQHQLALFDAAQKFAGLVMTIIQGGIAIYTGNYGNRSDIGIFGSIAILVQLIASALVIILLDETLQNGYGIGSGISLFIATNICENIVWKLFSFQSNRYGHGKEYEGAIIGFFHLLITRKDKLRAIREGLFRPHLPNISNLLATLFVFAAVVLFEHIKINVGLQNTVNGADQKPFEIKLFYASNTPIIVQSTIISQVQSFSRMIWMHWPDSIVTKILGVWHASEGYSMDYARPISGIAYYLNAPTSVKQTIADPFHTIVYLTIILSTAGLIAYYYTTKMGGNGPKDVIESIRRNRLTFKGGQKYGENKINEYIPTAAALGGIITGFLSFVADFLGAFGSGTGIILAVSTIYDFWMDFSKEAEQTGMNLSFLNKF